MVMVDRILRLYGLAVGLVIVLIVAGFAALYVFAPAIDPWKEERQAFRNATPIGASEGDVRAALGKPAEEYTAQNAPADYYVDGYSYRKRPISNKVLIYIGTEPICNVWLDEAGKVEDRFVGGS
jgi:hypothetical protein